MRKRQVITCLECSLPRVEGARRLCPKCHQQMAIRMRYPMLNQSVANRGILGPATTEAEPTDHLPGTREKLVELCRRAEAGEQLWSSMDARRDVG